MDIMKCLMSEGGHCFLSGDRYLVQGSTDCTIACYLSNDNAIKTHCSIAVNTFSKNAIPQVSPNHYLMSVIQSSSIECRWPVYTDTKTANPTLG